MEIQRSFLGTPFTNSRRIALFLISKYAFFEAFHEDLIATNVKMKFDVVIWGRGLEGCM
jgi:hypothetical protein